jgi:protein-S-isoprenylcysteine O-methyltransferase Ste14
MTSFLFILIFDWADCRRLRALKAVALTLSAGALVSSTALLIASPERLALPLALRVACWTGAGAFLFLLVVSLFVETSFLGSQKEERVLRTTGTYSLVRHPGVLWFFFFHLSLALATAATQLLVAVPFWTGANLVLVAIEDRVFFPRLFGDSYIAYRHAVPFVVPSRASVRNCVATFRLTRQGSADSRRRPWRP